MSLSKAFRNIMAAGLVTMGMLAPAHAAPFCIDVTGLTRECIYYDTVECRQQAGKLGGRCVANPAELHLVPGAGRYCLVDSSLAALCLYSDTATCESDAYRKGAVCIDSGAGSADVDIFRSDPGRRY